MVVETNERFGSKNCENHEDVNEKVQNEKMLVNSSFPCHAMLLSASMVNLWIYFAHFVCRVLACRRA